VSGLRPEDRGDDRWDAPAARVRTVGGGSMSSPEFRWCGYCTSSDGKPKHSFTSEYDAGMALVEAKIKASLKGNRKRKEQRKYCCPVASGWWHLSSADEAEIEIRKAQQARAKELAPYARALQVSLAGSDLAERADELAALLHDNGWTPPRRASRAA
jgi:hypothetical protein